MITNFVIRHGRYALLPFFVSEENPFDRVEVDKQNVFDKSSETGWDRLKALVQPHKDLVLHPKTTNLIHTAIGTFIMGGLFGAVSTSRSTFIQFIETNEATKFKSHFDAKRQLADKMFLSFLRGGTTMGIKISFFCTSLMTAYTLLSTYRDKDAIWYYSIGGAYAGAIYKFPLGPKGMVSGGVFGALFGTVYGSFHFFILMLMKKNEEQFRENIFNKSQKHDEAVRAAIKNIKLKEMEVDYHEQMTLKPGQ